MDQFVALLKRLLTGREPEQIITSQIRDAKRDLLICHAEMEYCKFRAAMLAERLRRLEDDPYGVVNNNGN